MNLKEAKHRLLRDKKRRQAYERVDLAYEIGKMITDARIARYMTQQKLAELVGTKQPSIARLEKGHTLPSLNFLQKVALAFDTQLLPPRLQFLEEDQDTSTVNVNEDIKIRDYDFGLQPIWNTSVTGFTHSMPGRKVIYVNS